MQHALAIWTVECMEVKNLSHRKATTIPSSALKGTLNSQESNSNKYKSAGGIGFSFFFLSQKVLETLSSPHRTSQKPPMTCIW